MTAERGASKACGGSDPGDPATQWTGHGPPWSRNEQWLGGCQSRERKIGSALVAAADTQRSTREKIVLDIGNQQRITDSEGLHTIGALRSIPSFDTVTALAAKAT